MKITNRIRAFATAGLLALSLAATTVGAVGAERNTTPTDDGVRCAAYDPNTGEWEFYLPGEVITVIDSNGVGHIRRCGGSGEWQKESRVVRPAVRQPGKPPVAVLVP